MKTYEALIAMSLISGSANATDFSFAGNFKHRNEVQELNFTVAGTAKEVALRTWSFAGGTNAEGASSNTVDSTPWLRFSTPQAFVSVLATTGAR